MSAVIVHKYVDPELKGLKKCEEADCAKCMMSEPTRLLCDNDAEAYLCKARLYDTCSLACFVPRES